MIFLLEGLIAIELRFWKIIYTKFVTNMDRYSLSSCIFLNMAGNNLTYPLRSYP
jgi:hypothetical protein